MSRLRKELKQTRPFGSLAEEVFLSIVRTADHLTAAQVEELRPHDLSVSQYNVLRILRGAGPDGLPCHEIGARMVSRLPDITRLLDRLERRSLVDRQRSRTDRRVVEVRITSTGLELLTALDAPIAALPPRLLAALDQRELAVLNDLLARIRAT